MRGAQRQIQDASGGNFLLAHEAMCSVRARTGEPLPLDEVLAEIKYRREYVDALNRPSTDAENEAAADRAIRRAQAQ